jgi:hypothetical protein
MIRDERFLLFEREGVKKERSDKTSSESFKTEPMIQIGITELCYPKESQQNIQTRQNQSSYSNFIE